MHRVIEALEARIAPAAVFTYTEADGDKVTVKTSAKVTAEYFESLASFNGDNLSALNLIDPVFQNSSLTITVKKAGGGNGMASIGHIQANVDLKNVIIKGDLVTIDVGDSNHTTAPISKLQVQNLGGINDEDSYFRGDVKQIKILGNFTGDINAFRINAISISGSILGMSDIEANSIGSIVVGGDMEGEIDVNTVINSVRIAGNLHGKDSGNGNISADRINSISIGKSILGSEQSSSQITAETIGKLVVGENVSGGTQDQSGVVWADEIGVVTIKGNVIGGAGYGSGQISGNRFGSVRIGGDLQGGSGEWSGSVNASEGGSIDKVVIGGSIIGGSNYSSGTLAASDIGSASIGKSIIGGSGQNSGSVQSSYEIGLLRIGGDLKGGSGDRSGWVSASEYGSINKVVINGSIIGGINTFSGAIYAFGISSASIGKSIIGGEGQYTGSVSAYGIGNVSVAKDVLGGAGEYSGGIHGLRGILSVKIGNDLIGDGVRSGSIESVEGSIGSVTIGGDLGNKSGKTSGIYAQQSIGSVTIGGNATGTEYGSLGIHAGLNYPANSTVPAIGSVKIKGSVTNFQIGAGTYGNLSAASASIGSVNIGGDFKTSSIVAGVAAGPDGFFGTADDIVAASAPDVVSRIASVVIGRSVTGSPETPNDAYGIIAQHIVELKVKGVKQPLEPGETNDLAAKLLGGTDDVRYVEMPLVVET